MKKLTGIKKKLLIIGACVFSFSLLFGSVVIASNKNKEINEEVATFTNTENESGDKSKTELEAALVESSFMKKLKEKENSLEKEDTLEEKEEIPESKVASETKPLSEIVAEKNKDKTENTTQNSSNSNNTSKNNSNSSNTTNKNSNSSNTSKNNSNSNNTTNKNPNSSNTTQNNPNSNNTTNKNPNSGNTTQNNSNSNNTTNNNSNNSNTQTPVSKPTQPPVTTPKEENKQEEKPVHVHDWKEQYKEVDNGYWDKKVIKEAWTEYKEIYQTTYHDICNGCGLDVTEIIRANGYNAHGKEQMLAGNTACGSYRTGVPKRTKVGTETIEHEAITEDVWIPKIEKVLTGYKCSSCGAVK